ncbi:hypothetical protein [Frigoriflavimonas asaccharolytica]|uniref:Uncharacterized protein n=1 Tax=Frigoriflavimonas asaccharolytica TaxID=2735899 RepID=A0A8J8G725_9FLAO|nr:hypothetical protein [Frigoriflavimonas asaccharolytica]NRS92516.1 hypothetical protein [Frigoriflavimonas asaccharolytica]
MEFMNLQFRNNQLQIQKWWSEKRFIYNGGLFISGIFEFILYAILGILLIAPIDYDFEITLFTMVFQGFGYLLMMLFANLFFNLGYSVDKYFNLENSENFRKNVFNLGFWFSVLLPFLVPLNIVIIYLLNYYK